MRYLYETGEKGFLLVSDLITTLEAVRAEHGDVRVLVRSYESGYDDVAEVLLMPAVDEDDRTRRRDGRFQHPYKASKTDAPVLPRVAVIA